MTTFGRKPTMFVLAAFAGLLCFSCVRESEAQVRRYQPQTPTVSPYLNLTRRNVGGLPNYYALVRPQIQQRQFNLQQRALNIRQQGEITRLESEVQRKLDPATATGTGSWFMVPGNQTSFLNTSRYFPEPIRRAGRR